MNCLLYYRDVSGKLCQINGTDVDSTDQARQMAEDLLVSEREAWSSPILAVVHGGKL